MKKLIALFFTVIVIAMGTGLVLNYYPHPPKTSPMDDAQDTLDGHRTYNILLCGVDQDQYNADVVILATFDPEKKSLKLLSLPRDTMSHVTRSIKKLNASYSDHHPADIEQTKKEVTMLTGLKIDRYIVSTFDGFQKAIDAIGGVPMNVPEDLHYSDPYQNLDINIKAGEQVLNGKNALHFVRYRSGYVQGDLGRIKAQHLFFEALGKRLLSASTIPKVPDLADVISKDMQTDLTASEMIWFAKEAKGMNLKENVHMFTLPGSPGYIDELSYYLPSQKGILAMLNAEYPKSTEWTAQDLDLIPMAANVSPTFGYGSEEAENGSQLPKKVEDGQAPAESSSAPLAPDATETNYGYGGAYQPPREQNTNQGARSYTTVVSGGSSSSGQNAPAQKPAETPSPAPAPAPAPAPSTPAETPKATPAH